MKIKSVGYKKLPKKQGSNKKKKIKRMKRIWTKLEVGKRNKGERKKNLERSKRREGKDKKKKYTRKNAKREKEHLYKCMTKWL